MDQQDGGTGGDGDVTPFRTAEDDRFQYGTNNQLPVGPKRLQVTASHSEEGYGVASLMDGEVSTAWRAPAAGEPVSLTIDLDRPRRVKFLRIQSDADGWGGVQGYRLLGRAGGKGAFQLLTAGALDSTQLEEKIVLGEGAVVRTLQLVVESHHGSGASIAELSVVVSSGFLSLPKRYAFEGRRLYQSIAMDKTDHEVRFGGTLPRGASPNTNTLNGLSVSWTPKGADVVGKRWMWELKADGGSDAVRSEPITADVFPMEEVGSGEVRFNQGGTFTLTEGPFAGLVVEVGEPRQRNYTGATRLTVRVYRVKTFEWGGKVRALSDHAPAPVEGFGEALMLVPSGAFNARQYTHPLTITMPLPSGDGAPTSADVVAVGYRQRVKRSVLRDPYMFVANGREAVPMIPTVEGQAVTFPGNFWSAYGLGRSQRLSRAIRHKDADVGEVVLLTGRNGDVGGASLAAQIERLKALSAAASEALEKGFWCAPDQGPYRVVMVEDFDGTTALSHAVLTRHAAYITGSFEADVERAGRTLAGTLARELFQLHDLRAGRALVHYAPPESDLDILTASGLDEAAAAYAEFRVDPESPMLYGAESRTWMGPSFLEGGPGYRQWPLVAFAHTREPTTCVDRTDLRRAWIDYADALIRGDVTEANFGPNAATIKSRVKVEPFEHTFKGEMIKQEGQQGGTRLIHLTNPDTEPKRVMVRSTGYMDVIEVLSDDRQTVLFRVEKTSYADTDIAFVIPAQSAVWVVLHIDTDEPGDRTVRIVRPARLTKFSSVHQRVVPVGVNQYEVRRGEHNLEEYQVNVPDAYEINVGYRLYLKTDNACGWAWETTYPRKNDDEINGSRWTSGWLHNLNYMSVFLPWDCGPIYVDAFTHPSGYFYFYERSLNPRSVVTSDPTWRPSAHAEPGAVYPDHVWHRTFRDREGAEAYYTSHPWPGAPTSGGTVSHLDLSTEHAQYIAGDAGALDAAAERLATALCASVTTDPAACIAGRLEAAKTQVSVEGWGFLVMTTAAGEGSALGFCREQWRSRTVSVELPAQPDEMIWARECRLAEGETVGIDRACFSGAADAPVWWIADADWPLKNAPLAVSCGE